MIEQGIPDVNVWNWALALAPIATLLILMVGFKFGGARAGAAGWLVAIVVAIFRFGAGTDLLAYSQGKAALLSIWVLYIIWAALFLFHLVNESGSIALISRGISRITSNRTLQVVLLAWVFTSFLQGIAGYGVPIAVVAPLMVGMGFSATAAVVMTSIGHTWAVSFGSLGASFYAVVGVTNLESSDIATDCAILLGITCFLCGGAVFLYRSGLSGLKKTVLIVLLVGLAMAAVQFAAVEFGIYSLAAFSGGVAGVLVVLGISRTRLSALGGSVADGEGRSAEEPDDLRDLLIASSAYLLLVVIVLLAETVRPLSDLLASLSVKIPFPETTTSYGWTNAAVDSFRTIKPFGEAGALLLYASFGAILIYLKFGRLTVSQLGVVASKTVDSALGSSLGIVTMVGMALIMTDSGMTFLLAKGIVSVAGPLYPLLSPFVGVIGAFMTGSNTNSNVLFGALQRDSAVLLGLPPSLLIGAQTVGGAVGSMFAPAKVIVGCSTVGLAGKEGPVISQLVRYGAGIALVIGAITLIWSQFV